MTSSTELPLRCNCRKHDITSLRCARCSVPICPDCSVVAPAGMICRACAHGKVGRLYQVERERIAPAVVATLGAAVMLGWILEGAFGRFGFFKLLFDYMYGSAIAEVALRTTGRKRGGQMEALAVSCALIGVLEGCYLASPGLHGAAAFYVILSQPWTYVDLAIAGYAGLTRIRYI